MYGLSWLAVITQGVAGLILPRTYVQSCEENSVVVPFTTFPHQTWLPLTETVEGMVSMVIDGQAQLGRKDTEQEWIYQ